MKHSLAYYQTDSLAPPPLLADLPVITDAGELEPFDGYFCFEPKDANQVLHFYAKLEGHATGFSLDFSQGAIAWRRSHGGGRKQQIAKACGLKHNWQPSILDATGGLGRDASELRNLGCRLRLIERSPYVAALLQDAITRAASHHETQELFAHDFQLFQGQANELIQQLSAEQQPDIIYLDPMFPPRNKSAAVKKEMRLVKLLVGEDLDADELLPLALQHAKYRVVVKRPSYAPYLNQQKPSMSIESKANRFDVYVKQAIPS